MNHTEITLTIDPNFKIVPNSKTPNQVSFIDLCENAKLFRLEQDGFLEPVELPQEADVLKLYYDEHSAHSFFLKLFQSRTLRRMLCRKLRQHGIEFFETIDLTSNGGLWHEEIDSLELTFYNSPELWLKVFSSFFCEAQILEAYTNSYKEEINPIVTIAKKMGKDIISLNSHNVLLNLDPGSFHKIYALIYPESKLPA